MVFLFHRKTGKKATAFTVDTVSIQIQPSLSQSSSTSSMNELQVVDPPGSSPKLSRKVQVSW